jgi:hypothetical protein
MTDPDAVEVDPKIRVGTDVFGDPILQVELVTPPGHAMTPETAELMALKLLAAAAYARNRAGAYRQLVLDGMAELDARRTIERLFPS